MARAMNGFKIGKTGYEVVNIRSDRRKHNSIYYMTIHGPRGGSVKKTIEASNVPDLKKRLLKIYK